MYWTIRIWNDESRKKSSIFRIRLHYFRLDFPVSHLEKGEKCLCINARNNHFYISTWWTFNANSSISMCISQSEWACILSEHYLCTLHSREWKLPISSFPFLLVFGKKEIKSSNEMERREARDDEDWKNARSEVLLAANRVPQRGCSTDRSLTHWLQTAVW